MRIGYKGFKKGLICTAAGRTEQYEIGKIHTKEELQNPPSDYPRLCTDQGYHFCDNLIQVNPYYGLTNPDNVFAEIEVLGKTTSDNEKCTTTSFRIIKMINNEEILDAMAAQNLHLEEVRKIQEACPTAIISGSVMLFLRGVRLKRWTTSDLSDLDIILPYYQDLVSLTGGKRNKYTPAKADKKKWKKSGSDFDNQEMVLDVKCDIRIDPMATYEVIEYGGFGYKVSDLYTTLAAKCRYALQGGDKHIDDIEEMLRVGEYRKERPEPINLGKDPIYHPF